MNSNNIIYIDNCIVSCDKEELAVHSPGPNKHAKHTYELFLSVMLQIKGFFLWNEGTFLCWSNCWLKFCLYNSKVSFAILSLHIHPENGPLFIFISNHTSLLTAFPHVNSKIAL